jgi:2-keto-4-pentenoate hydratase
MTPEQIEEAASRLFEAERTGTQCGLLSLAYPDMTLDDAYAVQSALVAKKRAAGTGVIGWKIGLTSRAMQQALNITTSLTAACCSTTCCLQTARRSPRAGSSSRVSRPRSPLS